MNGIAHGADGLPIYADARQRNREYAERAVLIESPAASWTTPIQLAGLMSCVHVSGSVHLR